MKLLTIVGSRPQIIKSSWLSFIINKKFTKKLNEVVVDTGQHYTPELINLFRHKNFNYKPKYKLNEKTEFKLINIVSKLEKIIIKEKPDLVLVFGDTRSALVGSIAAKKVGIKLAHVESGLRSKNFDMPEEINRILIDNISDYLYCPDNNSKKNLDEENLGKKSLISGDILDDIFFHFQKFIRPKNKIIYKNLDLNKKYILFTCHRYETLKSKEKLENVLKAISHLSKKNQIIFLVHPNTKNKINRYKLNKYLKDIILSPPLEYLQCLELQKYCSLLITDSGGLQRESFLFNKNCVLIRNETEWKHILSSTKVCGYNPKQIIFYVNKILKILNKPKKNFKVKTSNNADLILRDIFKKISS